MQPKAVLKAFIIILIIALLTALVAMVLGFLNPLFFWALFIFGAVFAYWILPKLR